jgi:biopolymer transport protein ExbB/TolQ
MNPYQPPSTDPVKVKKRGKNFIGLVVCSGIALLAPPLGCAATVLVLSSAFQGTAGTADPSQKATVLANGISAAMNGFAAGLVVSLVAMVLAVIFAIRLVRERRVASG